MLLPQNNMSSCHLPSWAAIDANVVIAKCEHTIEHITIRRGQLDAEYVENYRRTHHRGWWWNRRELTKEEAEVEILGQKSVSVGCALHFLDYPSQYGWGTLDVARKLLALAKNAADGKVFVTTEDWDHIK